MKEKANSVPLITNADARRFWLMATIGKESECWDWQGTKDKNGYGKFYLAGKQVRAHRVSISIAKDVSVLGWHVLHSCDNPSCVNPSHLFLGTNQENTQDKCRKGRHSCGYGDKNGSRTRPERLARGERNPQAKLTSGQVIAIRRDYASRKTSQYRLSAQYGVAQSLISLIVRGKVWSHLRELDGVVPREGAK
jgi:hypothetical protein